jgi:diaminopimelate epimerase
MLHGAGGLVAAVCARGAGVGADGLVVLDAPGVDRVRIAYYNSDGSRAALCGNATLCSASLAVHLGAAALDRPFMIETDAGALRAL